MQNTFYHHPATMERIPLFITVLCCFALCACSIKSLAYLRNFTNQSALIDVYVLEKKRMPDLPDTVKGANEILPIESGMGKKLNSVQTVVIKDSVHFTFELRPHTTADLTDMTGMIMNGSWKTDLRIVVLAGSKTDTIANGWGGPDKRKFSLYEKGLSDPIYYYDVK